MKVFNEIETEFIQNQKLKDFLYFIDDYFKKTIIDAYKSNQDNMIISICEDFDIIINMIMSICKTRNKF